MKIHTGTLTLRLPKELLTKLSKLAKQARQHRSTLVREILEQAVKKSTPTVLAFVATLMLCAASASAQSLDATFDWMQNTAPRSTYFAARNAYGCQTDQIRSITHRGCSVTIQEYDEQCRDKKTLSYSITFNLGDLDPNGVEANASRLVPSEGSVLIQTTDNRSLIEETFPDIGPSKFDFQAFWFESPAYAQRFARAMRHAITLCGGKPSTF